VAGWRCGRPLAWDRPPLGDQPVVVLTPEGTLAGIARVLQAGLLQPKLVFDATG
jgi:tRNA pseudouridine55 synthase